jgi:hypothetical protein
MTVYAIFRSSVPYRVTISTSDICAAPSLHKSYELSPVRHKEQTFEGTVQATRPRNTSASSSSYLHSIS